MRTFIFSEMGRLQYNLSISCSTIWRKYGVIIGKLRMFIFVAMEKLYIRKITKVIYVIFVTMDMQTLYRYLYIHSAAAPKLATLCVVLWLLSLRNTI